MLIHMLLGVSGIQVFAYFRSTLPDMIQKKAFRKSPSKFSEKYLSKSLFNNASATNIFQRFYLKHI